MTQKEQKNRRKVSHTLARPLDMLGATACSPFLNPTPWPPPPTPLHTPRATPTPVDAPQWWNKLPTVLRTAEPWGPPPSTPPHLIPGGGKSSTVKVHPSILFQPPGFSLSHNSAARRNEYWVTSTGWVAGSLLLTDQIIRQVLQL